MLNREQIKKLIEKENLIEGYINLDKQITPNGFDLTAAEISSLSRKGSLDFSNSERVIPQGESVPCEKKNPEDSFGWWHLPKGTYKVCTNETVHMPVNMTACAVSRTSLLRMGAFTQNGVWDAGFCGRSEFLLVVANEAGIDIKQNARLIQLVFIPIEETKAYNGIYQNFGVNHGK